MTGCHVLSGDAQLGGVGGRTVSVHLRHKDKILSDNKQKLHKHTLRQ